MPPQICHEHCPADSDGVGLVVGLAALALAAVAIVLFIVKYAVILGVGLLGVALVTACLYRLALKFMVVRVQPRAEMAAAPLRPVATISVLRRQVQALPARSATAIAPPRRLAIEAPRRVYGPSYEQSAVIPRTDRL